MRDHEDGDQEVDGADPELPGAPAGAVSLEDRLRRLDEIVTQLEGGEIELESGLALFEEGVRHIREAEKLLSQAELRVEELVGDVGEFEVRSSEALGG